MKQQSTRNELNLCNLRQNSLFFLIYFLRMDFKDFCQYFTDVVVCRLVERALLWPSSHWKEVHLYGEWAPAPASPETPPPAVPHSSLSSGRIASKPGGTKRRGNRKEARLGESRQTGGKGGGCERDTAMEETTQEAGGWEAQMDKRSRCGGCINHRDTFLHNPQVKEQRKYFSGGQKFCVI